MLHVPGDRMHLVPKDVYPAVLIVFDRNPVGATKCLTVRTGSLRTFLPLHARPINLVVFQGSPGPKSVQHSSPEKLPA